MDIFGDIILHAQVLPAPGVLGDMLALIDISLSKVVCALIM